MGESHGRDVRRDGLTGRVFPGVGDGPHEGVLVLHGAGGGGGYEREYARLLAHHGYTAFCPSYFDAPGAPDALRKVPLSLFERAVEWLGSRPDVGGSHVGVVGFSRGGEAALLAGAHLDAVGAVVAYVASGYAFPAPTWMDGVDDEVAAWTVGGEPVPYVPVEAVVRTEQSGVEDIVVDEDDVAADPVERAGADRLERATIPVEGVDGPVLLVSGGEDAVWDSARLSAVAADRLAARDHPWPVAHRVFPAAGHAIRVPYAGAGGGEHRLGGTAAANARAAAAAWRAALETLAGGLRER